MVTATTRVRAEKQAYASNDEAWGDHLNEGVFDRFDEAIGQFLLKALTGNYTLDVQNYVADEARAPICWFTGTGSWTVTVPAVSYKRLVRNDCTGDLTITPSGGTGAVIRAGRSAWWYSDGSVAYVMDPTLDEIKAPAAAVAMNGQKLTGAGKATSTNDVATLANTVAEFAAPAGPLAMNSQKITSLATPTVATDAANKNYVDSFAFNAALPGGSAAGQVAVWNGTAPVWGAVDLADSDARTGVLPLANGGTGGLLTVPYGGTGLATLTAGSVLVGSGTGNVALAAPGAAGTALLSNGVGVAPSFQALAAAGLVLIQTQTVSTAVSSISFTGINSTYDCYIIILSQVVPASATNLLMRTSTNGGASYDSAAGNYQYAANVRVSNAITQYYSTASTYGGDAIYLTTNNSSVAIDNTSASGGVSGSVRLFRPSQARRASIVYELGYDGGTPQVVVTGSACRAASADVDAVQFLMASGNISAGSISLYGVRK